MRRLSILTASMMMLLLLAGAAPVAHALSFELSAASVQLPGEATPGVRDLALRGELEADKNHARLKLRSLRARTEATGELRASGQGRLHRDGHWQLQWQLDDATDLAQGAAGSLQQAADRTLELRFDASALNLERIAPLLVRHLASLAALDLQAGGQLDLQLTARVKDRQWQSQGQLRLAQGSFGLDEGRHAGENLTVDVSWNARGTERLDQVRLETHGGLRGGQAYVEPVFVDFDAQPVAFQLTLQQQHAAGPEAPNVIHVQRLDWRQQGVGTLQAAATLLRHPSSAQNWTLDEASADWQDLQLGPAFSGYAQPFLAGQRLEALSTAGRSSGHLRWTQAQPHVLDARLEQVSVSLGENWQAEGIDGRLHWRAADGGAAPPPSQLRWTQGGLGGLQFGGGELQLRTQGKELELLAPLRIPLAGGALRMDRLRLADLGSPQADAQLEAMIEPLDLAVLCRAFGWPEFSGELSGRIPGVRLHDGVLEVDGALTAQAFDGDVRIESLRVLDPFGRLPRVTGDIRLRNLDLGLLTSAFAFGRIEGRLDGDVEDLRLLDWKPVSFRARLGTPADDRSRHRISQRAIDTLSSIGGGPTGLLKRGVLGLFDDFAYARIGWSCVLERGICEMDGVKPAGNGGYVLVQGRWLPRIDVVGYNRRVDWNTFVQQLLNARQSGPAQVR